jgi:nitrogenase molybdenum-iron protein alpha/beta subunit
MTAKEKAKELVLKYLRLQEKDCDWIHKGIAKQSALIAVDEILDIPYTFDEVQFDYWFEVKQQIEKQ